jgi:hypothetical protein
MIPGGDLLMYSCTGRWNQYERERSERKEVGG